MLNFCTLFDSNYMVKGLCMYDSLKKVCSDFHLYIFAFDDKALNILKELQLDRATIISLQDFEDDELLKVKENRNKAEYCWTCTSSTIRYCILQFNLSHCTYIDADLFFFSDPKVLIDEMGDKEVLITSHRYTPEYDLSATSGKYCVQFITFKNSANGLKVLNWWRNACLDWCYARYEDGKFGDQMYLDDWTSRFVGIHELEHLGGGVAPWNMQQYLFQSKKADVIGTEIATEKEFKLVFFHFHGFSSKNIGPLHKFHLNSYKLAISTKKLIFLPYLSAFKWQFEYLKAKNITYTGLGSTRASVLEFIKALAKWILRIDMNIIWGINKYGTSR